MMYLISISISNMKSNLTTDLILQFPAPYWISNHAHMITRPGLTWQFFQTADLLTFHILRKIFNAISPFKMVLFHTKYFLRVSCGIHNGLLCYHKKTKKATTENFFCHNNATKFVSVFLVCHNKWKLWRYSVLAILSKAITFQNSLC